MKNTKQKYLRKLGMLSLAALMSVEAPIALFAKDADKNSLPEQAAEPAQINWELRKERFEKFLEGHPEIAAKLDKNKDGIVDREDKQYQREQFMENRPNFKEHADQNGEDTGDAQEMQKAKKMWRKNHPSDLDNNPPGLAGGTGTNWENRPGPQGGAGMGPDKGYGRDKDNNPPGLKGGRGSNWENPRGPAGGPGASPNRKKKKK